MANSSPTAATEATKATAMPQPSIPDAQLSPEPDVDSATSFGHRAVQSAGGSSPQTPPSRYSALTGHIGQSSGRRGSALRQLQQGYGNQYVGRVIQAKLTVGQPGDVYEQEADRVADQIMRMPEDGAGSGVRISQQIQPLQIQRMCTACEEEEEDRIHRKEAGGAAPAVTPAVESRLNSTRGRGQPLPESVRTQMEPRFGTDLSRVRVHTGGEATALNRDLRAQAFTRQRDIYFGAGKYNPKSSSGQRLLAHELTHVVQQAGTVSSFIQRENGDAEENISLPPEEQICAPTESVPGAQECSLIEPVGLDHGPDYDPCEVNVASLTNSQLLAEYRSALAVVSRGRSATGYFDYRNLQRRLITERDRRVDMGHAWLATMPTAIPNPLYQIVDRTMGTFEVILVPGVTVEGEPESYRTAPLMTLIQFDHFLGTHNIRRIDADTFQLMISPSTTSRTEGSDLFWADPFGFGMNPLLNPLGSPGNPLRPPLIYTNPLSSGLLAPRGVAMPFAGVPLPEVFTNPDLLAGHTGRDRTIFLENPPLMDPQRTESMRVLIDNYRGQPGVTPRLDPHVYRVMFGESLPGVTGVQGGTVAVAQTDIPYLTQNFPGASAEALPPHLRGTPGTTGGNVLIPANPTAVNHAEHVALENLRQSIDSALAQGRITRSDLRGRTVFLLVEQEPCSSCAAGSAGAERAGVLQQFAELYPELTLEVRNMRNVTRAYIYRGGTLLNPSGATAPVEAPLLPPEPTTGTPRISGGRAVTYGAGLSGVIAVVTSGGVMMFDTADHPEWASELTLAGGLGTSSGAVGTGAELAIVRLGEHSMLRAATSGGVSRLTPGLTTGLGRFGGGAAGAVFIEGISMGLLEEREHSGGEVVTRVGRSAALGGGSVWAGAAVGTAVGGPVGFIVGLVGLAVGGILYYVGDKVVPGGREDWDAIEAGCAPLPSVERWRTVGSSRGGFMSPPFTCFVGSTQIQLADGSAKAIKHITVGDSVLSYNQEIGQMEPSRVQKVYAMPPKELLSLNFSNGVNLKVTAMHPLATPDGWKVAGELEIGNEVWSLPEGAAVHQGSMKAIVIESLIAEDPQGPVFDLTIEKTHTYFANSVLAHNKI